MGDDGGVSDVVDFFVSYTSADRPWAEWIAWELERVGHSTIIQAWDMQPGSNFVHEMHEATRVATRTIAVLSPAFLESDYCEAEWRAAFLKDPTGRERRLVPVRVRACEPDGLLGPLVYVDLVGLAPTASRDALLAGVRGERAKPARAPAHPRGGAGNQPPRPEGGAAVFNVPVMTRTFIGRSDALGQLERGLVGGVVAITQVHAIHGLGGVGKTQLAARYARLHRGDYDVIWWLRAESPSTLRADVASLAIALGLAGADTSERDALSAVRAWLERNGRWLIILDNVAAPDAIAEILPEGAGGHVLVTSRAHADWRALRAEPLALDVWERPESVAFLGARTGLVDAVALDQVSAALGDLPLALEQAAAYISTKAISLKGYLQRLQERAPELLATDGPPSYGHNVATVWTMAFAQIARQPVADDLLGVCAWLAPERIPRELLEVWARWRAVAPREVDEAIELLLTYAVLTPTADDAFGMHRLVQHVARAQDTRDGLAAAVDALLAAFPERLGWRQYARSGLEPHIRTVLEHVARSGAAAPLRAATLTTRFGEYVLWQEPSLHPEGTAYTAWG